MKPIKGDLKSSDAVIKKDFISCLVCSARGADALKDLLSDLSKQTVHKDHFEVVVLDNSLSGLSDLIEQFSKLISIKYIHHSSQATMLGALRNMTIECSQGEYVLFLDDDTRVPKEDFLQKALGVFKQTDPDVIMPLGKAFESYVIPAKAGIFSGKYQYLDPYSYAARCCLYQRRVLENLGGFFNELAAYEDIDMGIRAYISGVKVRKTEELEYFHPRLFFKSLQKPIAIGQSILKLRKHYPWYLWILIYFNALRFLPLGLVPTFPNRQWFKISWGVLIAPFIKKEHSYRS